MWGLFQDAAILRASMRERLHRPALSISVGRVGTFGPASIPFVLRSVDYVPQNVR